MIAGYGVKPHNVSKVLMNSRTNPLPRLNQSRFTSLLLAGAVLAMPGHALAQSASAPAQSEAVVVSMLSFFKVDDLSFGRIIPGQTAGTVVLAPTGVRTRSGGVALASGAAPQPAAFAGRGTFNQQVTISVGSNSITLNRIGGGGTMTMDSFVIGSTPTASLTTAPLAFRIGSSTGQFQFPVGATLRVKANQRSGNYAGTFTVTLQYQ